MAHKDILISKLNTTDIIRLMEYFGIQESQVRYRNDCLIFPKSNEEMFTSWSWRYWS